MYDPTKEPLTKKQKLIEKIRDLDSKLVGTEIAMDVVLKVDIYPSSLINKFFTILDSLPNRVLAKIIRDAKVELKELKIEEKEYKRERKKSAKEEE